ncbi:type IV pilin protein [Undibacterium sp. Di27W]|uniref:type IV pilin protein n=1 Tax=Undibacterium sp. Di27W TaxID=3413036 RepID=UPI003BF24101
MLNKKSQGGFTLIELLIAVAILAILTAIAAPSYTEHIRKGRRADVRSLLMQDVQFMERFLTENNNYKETAAGVAPVLPYLVSPIGSSGTAVDYDISFVGVPTATTYAIQAVPKSGGRMFGDACATYTINSVGARGLTGGPSLSVNDCWTK